MLGPESELSELRDLDLDHDVDLQSAATAGNRSLLCECVDACGEAQRSGSVTACHMADSSESFLAAFRM
jgi:hypothetical protein